MGRTWATGAIAFEIGLAPSDPRIISLFRYFIAKGRPIRHSRDELGAGSDRSFNSLQSGT